ncbi:NlpC/P60 family putative phage cell wall peptidase [Rhizomicrobium palustre]|uniref:NlpC/P60 family putative phage cell wall peptidase n=1 Tax=Rhizomicrobium palustre TaxID=189966 RepID=A0A846MXB6_9PROT|nr:NlpC/P60 family protein [Rhizomicrobium palustre]NIK87627.1 NlpC/P60 family putative phage cell wall peptidase [Rhizomicrobium palustre]
MAIDRETLLVAARGWIGTPYVHQAALKGVGCDCLGFLRGLYRELTGEEPEDVPPYDPSWHIGGEELHTGFARHFPEITSAAAKPGDVLLFRMVPRGPARHCGLLADKEGAPTLIHARQNKRVSEEVFSAFWRARAAYAFRFLKD